jgi:O-antigen biosynthesis protein
MKKQNILIIGSVWPEPSSSAAGTRILQLMELFNSLGWKITFASAAADSDFMFNFHNLNIDKAKISLNDSSFDLFIKELKPTIVLFDRFMTEEQFGWRVAENCPDAMRILDTEDLHCLRAARQKAFKEKRKFSEEDLNSDIAKREIASIYRCDLSLIISEFEMKLLIEHFKVNETLLYYIPFMLSPVDSATLIPFSERKDFVTIGNFLHEPNWNSVQYLKEEIWSLIKKELPEANLYIYGAYPSQKVNALHNTKEGFYIMGRTESAKTVIENSRILLAPLRFGAGLKGKLVEAMQFGTPSVTTEIGAEAMHGDFNWNGLIVNDAFGFAKAAISLYSDQQLWEQAQQDGIKIIHALYPKAESGKKLISGIITISETLRKHRSANFIGAMLMHHTIAGTKYMGKWIEEKNKLFP